MAQNITTLSPGTPSRSSALTRAFIAKPEFGPLVLLVLMLIVFGPRHPRVFDEEVPLDRSRLLLALFALLMFVLCFTPAPIRPMDLIAR